MNINNTNPTLGKTGLGGSGASAADKAREAQQVQARRTGAYGREPGSGSGDEVQLSDLSRAVNAERPGSAEREERIAGLQADVKAGRYRPPAAEVAARIVAEHRLPGAGNEGSGSKGE